MSLVRIAVVTVALAVTSFSAAASTAAKPIVEPSATARIARITWGVTTQSVVDLKKEGWTAWLQKQLHPRPAVLPTAVQAQIDAMTITRTPMAELGPQLDAIRKTNEKIPDVDQQRTANQAYQNRLVALEREARSRFILRAIYSQNQLQEQMVWFWMNHFNIDARKADGRLLIGDFEETAIRPNALGRFSELLRATAYHPAMLRYLDNMHNSANQINENYARELLELHTLGVGSGYSQRDVQELAGVFTGVGVTLRAPDIAPPKVSAGLERDYLRKDLLEFNPNRHDYRIKTFFGQPLKGRGLAEVDEALDRISHHPATSHFISKKIALYFVSDKPPQTLIDRMSASFTRSDGDIAEVLKTMFNSPEFAASLNDKFRDPVHYVLGSLRLAYGDQLITNTAPVIDWLDRLGEPLYNHATPDGFPLTQPEWASASQLVSRFEVARDMTLDGHLLFSKTNAPQNPAKPETLSMAKQASVQSVVPMLSAQTRSALAGAQTPLEWNTYFLSSPELMRR